MFILHRYIFVVAVFVLPTSQNIFNILTDVKTVIEEQFKKGHADEEILKTILFHQSSNLIDLEYYFENKAMCGMCPIAGNILITTRRRGYSRPFFTDLFNFLCNFFQSPRICNGYGKNFMDVLLYTIDNKANFTAELFCELLLNEYGCSYGDFFNWIIEIPPGDTRDTDVDQNQTFTILHLSDFHYDPKYTPNGNPACGEPLCCQNDQIVPLLSEDGCGYWGDYRNADAPWRLIENTIEQSKNKTFDFVYFTGDVIPHRNFDNSVAKNSRTITKMYSYIRQSFSVPIYPVFGNHEVHPVDYWSPSTMTDFNANWLFELAADQWPQMVGQNVSGTVLRGGYYTVSPTPGFRIIALNNNIGLSTNFWLWYDDVDAYNQLRWLVDTLLEAEKNNEKVHIISHVPVGTPSLLKSWDRQYSRIVERFASTITGQFNGHTHRDEFRVFYSSTNRTKAVGIAFNGGSVTPWGAKANPSFKYYTMDSTSFSLLDYEEYTFNLTLANSKDTYVPEWYKLYSFREVYNVENLLPSEVDKLLHRMATNHSLLDDYFRFYYRDANVGIEGGCDDRCKRNFLCKMVTVVYGRECQCRRFLNMYDEINL